MSVSAVFAVCVCGIFLFETLFCFVFSRAVERLIFLIALIARLIILIAS